VKRDTKILAAVLAAISAAILGASMLCTVAIANGASVRWRLLFRLLCHGIPERCLTIAGIPMPICARCTAIYGGLAVGVLLFLITAAVDRVPRERIARLLLYVAVVPLALDGLTQLARLRESTNLLRLETGLFLGAFFALWALTAVENRVLDSPSISTTESHGVPGFAQRTAAAGHHSAGECVGEDGQIHPLSRG
jgi:uncharacterized membrane protein